MLDIAHCSYFMRGDVLSTSRLLPIVASSKVALPLRSVVRLGFACDLIARQPYLSFQTGLSVVLLVLATGSVAREHPKNSSSGAPPFRLCFVVRPSFHKNSMGPSSLGAGPRECRFPVRECDLGPTLPRNAYHVGPRLGPEMGLHTCMAGGLSYRIGMLEIYTIIYICV